MKSLHYQRYLNELFDFERLNWELFCKKYETKETLRIVSGDNSLICGYRHLGWDSGILGVKTFRLDNIFFEGTAIKGSALDAFVGNIEESLGMEEADCAFFRFCGNEQEALKVFIDRGWFIGDKMNIYFASLPIKGKMELSAGSGLKVEEISLEQGKTFLSADTDLFIHSRIYNDPNIPKEKAQEFYRKLFESVVSHRGSLKVGLFLAGKMIGIAVGEADEDFHRELSYLWEIAIAEDARGRGYAEILFLEFCQALNKISKYLEVGTQMDNLGANKLYISSGMRLAANAVTLHKWLK